MKNALLVIAIIGAISQAFGQGKSQDKPAAAATKKESCFNDWYSLFRERGADVVADGTHDVIISIYIGEQSDCFIGKIDVAGGVLNSPLLIQKEDGSFEEFDKRATAAYLGSDEKLKQEYRAVHNGMSDAVQLRGGEFIRLFFYKTLRAKPKTNKRAPAPSALVK